MQYKGLEIGSRIKNLRIKKNVSVFEMAIRTNKSQSHIYRLEEGAVKIIDECTGNRCKYSIGNK